MDLVHFLDRRQGIESKRNRWWKWDSHFERFEVNKIKHSLISILFLHHFYYETIDGIPYVLLLSILSRSIPLCHLSSIGSPSRWWKESSSWILLTTFAGDTYTFICVCMCVCVFLRRIGLSCCSVGDSNDVCMGPRSCSSWKVFGKAATRRLFCGRGGNGGVGGKGFVSIFQLLEFIFWQNGCMLVLL